MRKWKKMTISRAVKEDWNRCADIIFDTEMGKKYYPTKDYVLKELEKSQNRDEIYVARNEDEKVHGILWYQQIGMFHTFPYLHIIAVDKDYQNKGIGSKLLDFFERQVLKECENQIRTKIFLTVGDFNETAENVYVNRGYAKICEIKGLFRKNITEKLYMKVVTKDVH